MKNEKKSAKLTHLLKELWLKLNSKRKNQLKILFVIMLLAGFAEMSSLGAVVPFLVVLSEPSKVNALPLIPSIVDYLKITNASELQIYLTIIFILFSLLSGALRILLLWASTRLSFAIGADISGEVYRRMLYQQYQYHINKNTSYLISTITNKVDGVTFGVLAPLLIIASSLIILLSVIAVLIFINPEIAFISAVIFGTSYGAVSQIVKYKLKRNSQQIAVEQRQVIKALQEGFGGIRDVLIDSSQKIYCNIYANSDRPLRRAQGSNMFISGSPRFVMESLGMTLIALIAYFLSNNTDGLVSSIPTLGLLALGAQRLLPILQNIYSSWATIAASKSALNEIVDALNLPLDSLSGNSQESKQHFQKSIEFLNVYFRYGSEMDWVLKDLTFKIQKGQKIGIIGSSGSGKSTSIDILMGLLEPTKGQIKVDGEYIENSNLKRWQKCISHVPQSIYLADTTILENIAFGVPKFLINVEKVKLAARQAQISDFIEDCELGYETFVGERGVKLSGGQRQRIGIARALYKETEILVLDEATSSLDSETEKSVMNFIDNLNNNITVIIIAHRISTIENCDYLIQIESGVITATGKYDDLILSNDGFKKLTGKLD
jgi:ATP-binding cassette, subfamily B, bacterial PglK